MHLPLISNLKAAWEKATRGEWAHKLEANAVLLRVGQPSFSNVWHFWSLPMFAVCPLTLFVADINSFFFGRNLTLHKIHLKCWPKTFSHGEAASTWCHCPKPRKMRQAALNWSQMVFTPMQFCQNYWNKEIKKRVLLGCVWDWDDPCHSVFTQRSIFGLCTIWPAAAAPSIGVQVWSLPKTFEGVMGNFVAKGYFQAIKGLLHGRASAAEAISYDLDWFRPWLKSAILWE